MWDNKRLVKSRNKVCTESVKSWKRASISVIYLKTFFKELLTKSC